MTYARRRPQLEAADTVEALTQAKLQKPDVMVVTGR